jgi:hypothetical protein
LSKSEDNVDKLDNLDKVDNPNNEKQKPLQAATMIIGSTTFQPGQKALEPKEQITAQIIFDKTSSYQEIIVSKGEEEFSHQGPYQFATDINIILYGATDTIFTVKAVSKKQAQKREDIFNVEMGVNLKALNIKSADDIKDFDIYLDENKIKTGESLVFNKYFINVSINFDTLPIQNVERIDLTTGEKTKLKIISDRCVDLPDIFSRDKAKYKYIFEVGTTKITRKGEFTVELLSPWIPTTSKVLDESKIKISCANSSACPDNVGLLLIEENGSIGRCTTFYIGNKTFVTNGHCLPDNSLGKENLPCNSFFTSYLLEKDSSGTRKLKRFTCDYIVQSAMDEFRDYTIYKVTSEPSVAPVMVGGDLEDTITAWSIYNPSNDFSTFYLEQSICTRMEGYDLFADNTANFTPNLGYGATVEKCKLAPGTSGSPLFNNGGQWVGLHYSGFTNHTKKEGLPPSAFGRSDLYNIKRGMNSRCLPLGPPIEPSCALFGENTNNRVWHFFDTVLTLPVKEKMDQFKPSYIAKSGSAYSKASIDFDNFIVTEDKANPSIHSFVTKPTCFDSKPSSIGICHFKIAYDIDARPTAGTFTSCEQAVGQFISSNNLLRFIVGDSMGKVYKSYPLKLPPCTN